MERNHATQGNCTTHRKHGLGSKLTRHRLLVSQLGAKLASWQIELAMFHQELRKIPGYVKASFFLCDALRPDFPRIERLCERLGLQFQRLQGALDRSWIEYRELIGHKPHDSEGSQNANTASGRQPQLWQRKAHKMGSQPKTARAVITPGSPWLFDPYELRLKHKDAKVVVLLERCRTGVGCCDETMHVARTKCPHRISTEDLGYLCRDIDTLLWPTQNLSYWGKELGPIDVRRVVEENLTLSEELARVEGQGSES